MLQKIQLDSIEYPDSDGMPMADNTKQLRWIVVLYGNLAAQYRNDPNVFVAGDLLWYPVKGEPEIRLAPDVMVIRGRPKGDRGSYRQWLENDIPPTVVFEILSPSNTVTEMDLKWMKYELYGVGEYYYFDPDANHLVGFVRQGEVLRRVRRIHEHVSPMLGIRFDLSGPEMIVRRADGRPFLTFEELEAARAEAEQQVDAANNRLRRVVALSRKARLGQTSVEELQELERLEAEIA